MERKQTIIRIILAIYVAFILSYQSKLGSIHYSLFFLLFSILLTIFFLKSNLNLTKRTKKFTIITSLITSILFSLGSIVYQKIYLKTNFEIFTFNNIIHLILYFIADYILSYFLFSILYSKIDTIKIHEKINNNNSKKVFFLSFIIIFICYIPYFLRCYPALMSPDSFVQINNIEKNIFINNHPFIETQFLGLIYKLGKLIFGPGNLALAFYIIIQMLIISLVFSLVVTYLYKKQVKKWIIILTLLFYALSPLHAFYSVTLWKDILFGVNFALILLAFLKINEEGFTKKNIAILILSLLILLFFRNNGIYIFIFLITFIILIYKKFKITIPLCASLLIIYFIITGPIYNKIGVIPTKSVEALSIPLQQVGRVIVLDQEIDKESQKYLNEIFNINYLKENYEQHLADNTKNSINLETFDKTKIKFFKVWFKLLIKHPLTYIESYLASTCGYWYPDVAYHAISFVNSETETYNAYEYNIKSAPKTPEFINKIIDRTADKTLPFSILIWSTGLYCYILFLMCMIYIYLHKFQNKNIICYLPLIGLYLTIMISSPVFAELRYIYGLFTCLPLIILIPFLNKKEGKKND